MSIPTPSYGSRRRTRYDGWTTSGETGAVLTASATGRKFTVYELVYKPGQLDATTAQDLLDVWDTAKGSAGTFTWTPFDDTTPATFRFVDDDIDLSVASVVAYGATVRLERVSL